MLQMVDNSPHNRVNDPKFIPQKAFNNFKYCLKNFRKV